MHFAEISEYVSKNYSDPELTVSQIAQYAGITEVQLRRIFKSEVNTCPAKFINFLRLEKAKALLSGTNMTIGEIAASSGISDTYYFSRLFKKELGITPTKFRNTNS